jgi:uncharacterized protein
MRVFITGGTGLIGRRLVSRLVDRGDSPVVLSRRSDEVRRDPSIRGIAVVQGDPNVRGRWESELDGCDAVVNLAGHNLFAERWNAKVKRKIRDSRVHSTESIIGALARAKDRPRILAQASAVGYYGSRGDEELTEDSPSGSDFMAVVCREWEEATHPAELLGLRVSRVRTGIVLARGEGALGVMTPIFRLGGAAPVGGDGLLRPAVGRQWMSWIHVDDLVGLYLLALDHPEARGPMNATAPNPARNAEFGRALARVLWRPFLPVGPPNALLRLVLGEVADVVTEGQRVLPARASALNYTFRHPDLAGALRDVFAAKPDAPERIPAAKAAPHH